MTVQDDGISFHVEMGATVQARAHLHHINNFISYVYKSPNSTRLQADGARNGNGEEDDEPDQQVFGIQLSAMLNCINIFGDATVKPVSAKAKEAREKWKQKQRGPSSNNRTSDGEDGEDEEQPYMRREARASSTTSTASSVYGKKKATTAMILTWEAIGEPLVLL